MTHTDSPSPAPPAYDQLEPRPVWRYFAGMSQVPRPSKKEERIRAHVRELCEDHGLAVDQDAAGNLVVRVPGSPGHESAPTVVLQAHLDMVCEKNAGTEHDFDIDPIRLLTDFDAEGEPIVRADGTTLGADNGIGVCLALAAATEDDVVHPPLELLFTIDEEEGMSGAENLDGSLLTGRTLLNLDTEEDAALYIGCAGGCDSNLSWTFDARPLDDDEPVYELRLRGLRGGHSGGDIHEGRGSATRLMARLLDRLDGLRLAHLEGGSKRNAIAREASAIVAWPGHDLERLQALARAVAEEGRAESREPGLEISAERVDLPPGDRLATSAADARRLVDSLLALPHGVAGMHPDIPELVETSNNLATITSKSVPSEAGTAATDTAATGTARRFDVGCLSRSSSASRMEEILRQIAAIGRLSGAEVGRANAYPGWQPDTSSPVLGTCRRVHAELFGAEPKVAAVHAGLECGLLGRRIPGLDMVSLGPRIEGAHSPDERVWVESVGLSWRYLKGLLAELATAPASDPRAATGTTSSAS